MQTRHVDIQIYLNSIILKTQKSTVPWVRELADAQVALERKIVSMNRRSKNLDWTVVASEYWPGIAETYAWVLLVVLRLQNELRKALKQDQPWAAEVPLNTCNGVDGQQERLIELCMECPHVLFGPEVTVREYQVGQAIGEGGGRSVYSAGLTDDRKWTAGKFRDKQTNTRDRKRWVS